MLDNGSQPLRRSLSENSLDAKRTSQSSESKERGLPKGTYFELFRQGKNHLDMQTSTGGASGSGDEVGGSGKVERSRDEEKPYEYQLEKDKKIQALEEQVAELRKENKCLNKQCEDWQNASKEALKLIEKVQGQVDRLYKEVRA